MIAIIEEAEQNPNFFLQPPKEVKVRKSNGILAAKKLKEIGEILFGKR